MRMPNWWNFTISGSSLPDFYWNVKSQEERMKKISENLWKLIKMNEEEIIILNDHEDRIILLEENGGGSGGPVDSDDVENLSSVPGLNVTEALDSLESRIDASIDTDDVINNSIIPGTTATDVFNQINTVGNSLDTRITNNTFDIADHETRITDLENGGGGGSVTDTDTLPIINATIESISGVANTQFEVNEQNVIGFNNHESRIVTLENSGGGGTTDDIVNNSTVVGSTATDALNTVDNRVTILENQGSGGTVNSDGVTNLSVVPGSNVTQALNDLDSRVGGGGSDPNAFSYSGAFLPAASNFIYTFGELHSIMNKYWPVQGTEVGDLAIPTTAYPGNVYIYRGGTDLINELIFINNQNTVWKYDLPENQNSASQLLSTNWILQENGGGASDTTQILLTTPADEIEDGIGANQYDVNFNNRVKHEEFNNRLVALEFPTKEVTSLYTSSDINQFNVTLSSSVLSFEMLIFTMNTGAKIYVNTPQFVNVDPNFIYSADGSIYKNDGTQTSNNEHNISFRIDENDPNTIIGTNNSHIGATIMGSRYTTYDGSGALLAHGFDINSGIVEILGIN